MCNCITDIEEKYKKHIEKEGLENANVNLENFDVIMKNKARMFDSGETNLAIPVEVKWKHECKSGRIIKKSKEVYFSVDYCPFCGEKK